MRTDTPRPHCPFCRSASYGTSYLPDTFFNKKTFRYITCRNCNLIYLDPFPSPADYEAMYPTAYQNGINPTLIEDGVKLPGLRFPYSKHFELMKKFAPGKKIVDYGCGQANFLINARAHGYDCDGVEYNPGHLKILEEQIKGSNFYLIDDFLKNETLKFDVIRLSNVLEHLDDPGGIMTQLVSKLNPSGILLIEGPIETNFSPAFMVRKLYFKLKTKSSSHPPTHIFFSNARNQAKFFKDRSLSEEHFEIIENEWPFPENRQEAKGIGGIFKYACAKLSKALCKLNRNWGNTFIYVGKKSTDR